MALPAVRFLYGQQWDAAAPLLQLMCVASAIYSMSSMARYLLVAGGHVRAQARIDALSVSLRIAALLLAAPFGLMALAWASVGATLCRVVLSWAALARLERIGTTDLARACGRSLVLALATALGPAAALAWIPPSSVQLGAAAVAALILWLLALTVLRHPLNQEMRLVGRSVAARMAH
jgi:O-antigen/teichoic acid export membrane protein